MGSTRCRLFGHRLRFTTDGPVMRWSCERGCTDAGGEKRYATEAEAQRYAAAFDRGRPRAPLGRRR